MINQRLQFGTFGGEECFAVEGCGERLVFGGHASVSGMPLTTEALPWVIAWIIPDVAYEWIGTVALGVGGIFFTWLTGKQARDQAERQATARLGHERTMAREARQQERLASAYVRLLGMVERMGQWAQMVKPIMDTNPPRPDRPLPDLDEQAEAEAVVNAFGSDEVREAFESWRKVIEEMVMAVNVSNLVQAYKRNEDMSGGSGEEYLKLHELRQPEAEARGALARQINQELRAGRTA
jgi:hypothetical protein